MTGIRRNFSGMTETGGMQVRSIQSPLEAGSLLAEPPWGGGASFKNCL